MATQNSEKRMTFNENIHMQDAMRYIENTYAKHYSGKVQATELIASADLGKGFCLGNIIKYASRYGKKFKSYEHNKDDLLKIIHYAVILMCIEEEQQVKSLHEKV